MAVGMAFADVGDSRIVHSIITQKHMKKSFLNVAGALIAALALSSSAMAVAINGSIGFNGTPTVDNPGNFAAATQITTYNDVTVAGGSLTGTYATFGIANGQAVTFAAPLKFNPAVVPVGNLWSFTVGANTFSFAASTMVSSYTAITNTWSIAGKGLASITGLDDTPGSYNLTLTNTGAAFSFAATTSVAPVPEGGVSAILLGMSLVAIGLAARRLKKA